MARISLSAPHLNSAESTTATEELQVIKPPPVGGCRSGRPVQVYAVAGRGDRDPRERPVHLQTDRHMMKCETACVVTVTDQKDIDQKVCGAASPTFLR